MEAISPSGHVRFDGHHVVIVRAGYARFTQGRGTKTIAVASITAVRWRSAGVFTKGFIAFTVPGAIEARSRSRQQTYEAVRDENAVVFARAQEPTFAQLRDIVEDVISQRHGPRTFRTGRSLSLIAMNGSHRSGRRPPRNSEPISATPSGLHPPPGVRAGGPDGMETVMRGSTAVRAGLP